jgi:hypothetical protein
MDYFTRLKNFWFPDLNAFWWLLLALPGLYFFQTVVHEGTHGLTAFVKTGSFPTVAPFPHLTETGGFLNGVTLYDPSVAEKPKPLERQDCNTQVKTPNTRLAGWIGMPQFVDILLIVCFTLIFMFADIRSAMLRFALRAWYLGAWIDFMFNTARHLVGGCKDTQDWSRVMLRADIGDGWFALLTWLLWLLILCHFVWVYWSAWGRNAVAESGFWDYRWIAFSLGLLSTVAVVWMLAVSDKGINKGNVVFVIPFILQCLSIVWCAIYFWLTFSRQTQSPG